jgi:hypothetical protein
MFKPKTSRRRYLVYEVNHTVLLVDTTSVGLPNEIFPPEGKEYNLPSLRFQAWQWAEKYLLEGGTSRNDLEKTRAALSKTSVALL